MLVFKNYRGREVRSLFILLTENMQLEDPQPWNKGKK